MNISRRAFLDLCKGSVAALGTAKLVELGSLLANPSAPTVLWVQGAACTGCSVSFLNRISGSSPKTAAEVLIQTVNLAYHPNIMALAGDSAANVLLNAEKTGNYILAVEGGVPTAFGGAACWAYSLNGVDVTFLSAVQSLAAGAKAVLSIGTCASFGGIPATGPNPAGIKGVSAATGKPTVNIPGCPAHPDWIVWGIANALTNTVGALDGNGRPKALYGQNIHDQCPRKPPLSQHPSCTEPWGCLGKVTQGPCAVSRWNNGVSWCVDQNSICIGCTSPTFAAASMRRASPTAGCSTACHGVDD
jgi:hydrogenase small subunit